MSNIKQTIDEAAEDYIKLNKRFADTGKAFIAGAQFQAERSFTLDQINELFMGSGRGYFDEYLDFKLNLCGTNPNYLKPDFKEWFEKYKKERK